MANTTYIRILQAIESFSSNHLQVKRFASDFPAQIPNFGNDDEQYPILFVSPSDSIFNINTNTFDLKVYCFDIIEKDRTNINTILSDTNSILNDLKIYLTDGQIAGIDILDSSTAIPINNSLLDFCAGWVMDIKLEVDTYSICEIPFSEFPLVSDICNNVVYANAITCETLNDCPTIIQIKEDIITISGSVGFDIYVTGGTYDNLSGIATFTNTSGQTFDVNGFFTSANDVYVTGGTFNSTANTATFINTSGGTFDVTGFTSATFTGTTNFLQKLDGANNLTNSNIFDNGNLISLSSNTKVFGGLSANTFVKSGGTANEFLKADGSVDNNSYQFLLTNPITGTGTTNTIPKFNSISALTNSNILDDGNLISLSSNTRVFGSITANTIVKSGGTSTQFLKADGSVDNNTYTTTTGTTLNINGNAYDLSTSREWRVAQGDTGVLTFGTGLTFNSTTAINIAPITGYIVNNETNPAIPTFTFINYSGATGLTVTTLGTGTETFVLLDGSGITFQNTFPTSTERKAKIWLGKIGHPANLITVVANEPDFITSPLAQHRDLFQAFNYINNGIYAFASGATLTVNTTGASVIGNGINLNNSKTNPNELFVTAQSPMNFVYRTQTGGTGTTTTIIDPNSFDVNGMITPVSSGATMQYIFLVPNGGYVIQYGQNQYATLNDAIAKVGRESFVLFPNLDKNALLVSVLAVASGATNLSDTSQAQFFKADKLGQIIGSAGGTSTTSLQGAYNNSVSPQIVTNNVLGALTIQGNGNDGNIVFQTQNSGATNTFIVNNAGSITATSFVKLFGLSNEFLLANGNVTAIIDGGLY